MVAPAIHYMKTGVPIAPRTSFDWILAESELKGAARDFYLIKGKAPQAGQIFQAPMQAKVLEKIADKGRDGFYKGEVAEDMVSSEGDDFASERDCSCRLGSVLPNFTSGSDHEEGAYHTH